MARRRAEGPRSARERSGSSKIHRFAVVEHYRSGVQISERLDPLLREPIHLSDVDVADLIVFLRTLTGTGARAARFGPL